MTRRLLAFAAATLLLSAAPPVHASGFAFFSCETSLNLAAGSGFNHCDGTVTGTVNGTIRLDFQYDATPCPILMSMAGEIYNNENYYADFTYDGVDLVLTGGHTGAGTMHPVFEMPGPSMCADTSADITFHGWWVAV